MLRFDDENYTMKNQNMGLEVAVGIIWYSVLSSTVLAGTDSLCFHHGSVLSWSLFIMAGLSVV